MIQLMRSQIREGELVPGETLPEVYRTADDAKEGAKKHFRSLHGAEPACTKPSVFNSPSTQLLELTGGGYVEVYELIVK